MSDARVRVVGIGASAGGLEAFHSFFGAMPPDSGMAFVVILHLPIGRKSMLVEILQRWTAMRAVEAQDGTRIEPNRVFVPPPHAAVTLQAGIANDWCLRIRMPKEDEPRDYRPVDGFFDSLAAALGEDAVGIVLSGTGSDGALGLKAIKQNGGLTMAQGTDGTRPLYDSMPAGAIATGAVDLIAPAEIMPSHLLSLRSLADEPGAPAGDTSDDLEALRLAICTTIREQIGHDFSGYRDKTFMRRVRRRMQVLNIGMVADYTNRLQVDRDEVVQLFRDLLIRVTSFFRDAETFEILEQAVIPRLFIGKGADSAVRVWVPGCATGEEAYSLAILLREHMSRVPNPPKVQVFGTDIDEAAIGTARLGLYPATLLDGLSPERRERFFRPSAHGYAATKDIRELCTFSPHSIVRDPPFSRLDLISCRNLLIYMDTDLQASIMPAFHYALVKRGVLLLGSAETASRHDGLFEPLDAAARIFVRRDVPSPLLQLRGAERPPAQPRSTAWPRPAPRRLGNAMPAPGFAEASATAPFAAPAASIQPAAGARRRWLSALRAAARAFTVSATSADLPRQLTQTQEQLQSITEEHEAVVEELRSANEELHSVNEELQSTNEELETSKEELQSVNEELHTVNSRLTEKVDELDRTNSDLRNLFDSTQIATVFLDRHMIVRNFTPAAASIYNLIPSDQGRPLSDIVSRLRYDRLGQDVAQVLETLQPLERRVSRLDRQAHYLMRILPYRAPDSTVSGTLVTFLDVSTIVAAEQHHRLLVDELNHRVKNMLTVVTSLALQTQRRSTTLEDFSQAFMGRLQSLTASYTLLSGQSWTDVSLNDVIVEETKPFRLTERNNIVIDGPEVRLASRGALAVGLAMHELVTNAVKYGALSVPEGSVRIDWRIDDRQDTPQLVLEWVETDGPPVAEPAKRGFGLTVIERGFAHELSGNAAVTFPPQGVYAIFRAPLDTLREPHS